MADRLGRENFLASTYHLLAKNCNHFSDAFCKAITKNKAGIPGWCAEMARGRETDSYLQGEPRRELGQCVLWPASVRHPASAD